MPDLMLAPQETDDVLSYIHTLRQCWGKKEIYRVFALMMAPCISIGSRDISDAPPGPKIDPSQCGRDRILEIEPETLREMVMTITLKEEGLVAIGIALGAGRESGRDDQIKSARKAGASTQDIKQAIAHARAVRQRAMEIIGGYPPAESNGKKRRSAIRRVAETSRAKELVSLGAAMGANSVGCLEKHLAAAEAVGITQEDIAEIVRLARSAGKTRPPISNSSPA